MSENRLTEADIGSIATQIAKLILDKYGPEVADEVFERWDEIGEWIPFGFDLVLTLQSAVTEAV